MPNAASATNNKKETKKEAANNKLRVEQLLLAAALGKLGNRKNSPSLANLIGARRRNNNTTNNVNRYINSSGKSRKIPETTPFYNRSLRRFLYQPSIGFYIILGQDRNGHLIKRRVPGHFYYRYDEKLARIVPFTRRLTQPVKKPKEKPPVANNNFKKQLLKSLLKN